MTEPRGATANEWFHFDFVLGLGSNLLPCVPAAPDVKVVPGSSLEGKVGKIPSQFNREGLAHGLKEWQKRPIQSAEVQQWSQDPRLNICVRLGHLSGVYALDIDIDDTRAHEVEAVIDEFAPNLPIRERENSCKMLLAFQMEESCKKRKIKLDDNPKGPAIELLADGQQFVAAGSHSSGVRYRWRGGLPTELPKLTLAQINRIWQRLTSAYATASSRATQSESLTSALPGNSSTSATDTSVLSVISDPEWSDLIAALRFLLNKAKDNDAWSAIGYALLSIQNTRPAQQLWLDFSRKADGYEAGAPEAWWQAHKSQTPRSDYRHIFSVALAQGWRRTSDPAIFQPVPQSTSASGAEGSGKESTDLTAGIIDVSPPPLTEKPVVRLVSGGYSQIVSQLEDILTPYVYVQGHHLVRPSEAHTNAEIRRKDDALMLIFATKAWAKVKFSELCTFQLWASKKQSWYNVDPSSEHINALLELGGWTRFRPLDAIARAPFVRPDGSICDVPGYDSRARVLYVPSTEYPAIPTEPSQDCAREALGRIRGVFDQFPWKEPASESAFLSHILSETGRLAIDRCPMFFYDAPSAGTGKGLLQEMAARIVHGSDPALRAWVSDGDEIRKSLYASLLAGDRSLWFDNIPDGHKVRSPELCAFLTSSTWKDRRLGESETLGVPNKCVLVGSGNNITPVSDLARRSLVIRMDANTEHMKERRFKIEDLRGYVMEHRPQLLVDALTIIKAYYATGGMIDMPVSLPSFERWSRTCRDPLIWLGLPDPVETQKETDDETHNAGAVFERLTAQFGDREFTGMDVARLVGGVMDSNGELANVLQQNGCAEPNNPLKVGYWLRGCRDKVSKGWKLVHVRHSMHGVRWKFVRIEESLT